MSGFAPVTDEPQIGAAVALTDPDGAMSACAAVHAERDGDGPSGRLLGTIDRHSGTSNYMVEVVVIETLVRGTADCEHIAVEHDEAGTRCTESRLLRVAHVGAVSRGAVQRQAAPVTPRPRSASATRERCSLRALTRPPPLEDSLSANEGEPRPQSGPNREGQR